MTLDLNHSNYGFMDNKVSQKKWHYNCMNLLNELKISLNNIFNKRKSEGREMKRVFQWKRYLEWRGLTPQEKLSAKRFLLTPVFAYLIISIFNQNFSLIVLFLIGYVFYKKFEKKGIRKK